MKIKTIERIIELQEEFSDLYCNTGLVGISSDSVHVRSEDFMGIFNDDQYEVRKVGYDFHLNADFRGVTFVTVVDDEDQYFDKIWKEYLNE